MITHEAIIVQETYRKIYHMGIGFHGYCCDYSIKEHKEYVEEDTLWQGALNSPILKVGEEIFITELERLVTVEKIIRTTMNEYMYYIHEVIEDEKTKESFEAVEEKMKKHKEEIFERNNEIIEESTKKKNWFKSLFSR